MKQVVEKVPMKQTVVLILVQTREKKVSFAINQFFKIGDK